MAPNSEPRRKVCLNSSPLLLRNERRWTRWDGDRLGCKLARITCIGSRACVPGQGVSDKEGHKIHKENTRFLYIEAHNDWDEFTENWQQEVNQLTKAIQGLIKPLIIDPPPKILLDRRGLVNCKTIKKVVLEEALQRAAAEQVTMDAPISTVHKAGLVLSFLKGSRLRGGPSRFA